MKKRSIAPDTFYVRQGKRYLDFILSFLGIIVLAPVMLIVAVLIGIKLGRPVIFCQERVGRNEKIFRMYKFRSMTDKKDRNGNLLPDEARLTGFGKQLRATSLDELPELINILKGDMSIVGPRPLMVRYLPYYTEKERHRHDVRPGLTGLAQVNGRNYVGWDEKFKMDLKYIKNLSLFRDIILLVKTLGIILKKENIETASSFEHNGILFQPLDEERTDKKRR